MTVIKVTTTQDVILQHAVEFTEPRPPETIWERQERGLDQLGYRLVGKSGSDVEKAAAAYMLSCLCNGGTDVPELNADITEKFEALLAALRAGGFRA